MLGTYRDSDAGANRVEATEYQLLGRASACGWAVTVALVEGRPVLLFAARSWEGRQPRYALTPLCEEFAPTLRDLARLGVERVRGTVTLVTEEPLCFTGGLPAIPEHHTETLAAWRAVAGD